MPTYTVTDPTTGKVLRLTGDSPPTESELENVFSSIAPDATPAPPLSPLAMGAARQKAELETAADDPSMVGSFLRNARENLGAGVGGALAGAASGAATGAGLGALGLNPFTVGIGTIIGSLGGGVAGAFGGQKIQEAIDPITEERQMALARDMEVNPITSFAGQVAPALITGKPSLSNLRNTITPLSRATSAAERAALINSKINVGSEVAIGGAFDVGQSLAMGQPLDLRQIALNAAAGGLFSDPNRLGRALGQSANPVKPPLTMAPVEAQVGAPLAPAQVATAPTQEPINRRIGTNTNPSRAFQIMEANALANRLKTGGEQDAPVIPAAVEAPLIPVQPLVESVAEPSILPPVEAPIVPLPAEASAAPPGRTLTLGPEETGIAPVAPENAGISPAPEAKQPDGYFSNENTVIVVDKATGDAVAEIPKEQAASLNTEKYTAVPPSEYLGQLNKGIRGETPSPQPEPAKAQGEGGVESIKDQRKVDRWNELNYKESQSKLPGKLKGEKLTKAEISERDALTPEVRPLVMESVNPASDKTVGNDINGSPIYESSTGTYYTFENGRPRTGPAFSEETPAPLTPKTPNAAPPITRNLGPEEVGIAPVAPESGDSLPNRSALIELESTANSAKKAVDDLGPEPPKPRPEKAFFGSNGRQGADPALVERYDANKKAYDQWRRKYNKLSKESVEASNAAFRAKENAGLDPLAPLAKPTESRTSAPSRTADVAGVEAEARKLVGDTENLRVVDEPNADWEARLNGDTIEVNAAKVGPEGVRSAMHEEIGHAIFRDEKERANFQRLHDSLDTETKQKLSDTVEKLYSDAPSSIKAEEKLVKALRAILDRTPEGRTLWQKLVQMARRAFKRITGQAAKDPEMIAAAMLRRGIGAVNKGSVGGAPKTSDIRYSNVSNTTPASSYRKALDAAKQEVGDRADYQTQAKTVKAEIAKLPKAEQNPATMRMYAELDEARIIGKGKDQQFKVELPKVVQELIASGKTPTEADVLKALAAKFPEQKGYLKKNFDRLHEDMLFAEEVSLAGENTPWKSYGASLRDHLGEMREGIKDGSSLRHIQRGLSLFRNTYFNGIGGKMHALADGKFTGKSSEAGRKYFADITGVRANQDGVNFEGIDGLAEVDVKKMTNDRIEFDTSLDTYFKEQGMDTPARVAWLERVSDHVVNPVRDAELASQPKLKEAVDYFVKRRRERLKYLREAGVDVGDAGERSLSRSLNVEKVLSNPKEFLDKASRAYTKKWAREIADLRKQEAVKAAEGKDTASIKEKIRKLEKKDAKKAAEKYLYAITSDDNGISSDGNDITAVEGGGGPSFLKKREFGPEADELLGKFYHRNIAEMDTAETLSSVRAATKARVLSAPALDAKGNPRKDGKIDPVGKWKKLRAELEAEGNQDMIPIAAQLVKDYLNLNGSNNDTARKLVGHMHTYTQLAYLSHATVASLGEPALIGARTGNLSDTARAYAQMAKGIARKLRGAGPDEIRILNRELGLVADSFDGLMSSHALADAFGGRGKGGRLVTNFHKITGLTGWTNLTFDAATKIGKSFISSQVKLAKAGGSMSNLAKRELNELGLSMKDIDVLNAFVTKLDGSSDHNTLILGDEPGADLYRKALTMFHKTGAALNPTRATRAAKANNPVAGMFYQLQSFLYDFHQKVTLRQARRVKDAYRGTMQIDGETVQLSTAERTKVATDALKAAAAIYGMQYGIQILRETLFVDPERNKRDKDKTSAEINMARALGAASRTGVLGPYDTLFNLISSARFQREPATVMLGPAVGGMSELFQSVVTLYGDRNSPNTNTAERKLARTAYNTLVTPAANAVFAGLPGGPLSAALVQAARHPLVREGAVKGIAGPMQTKKKGPLNTGSAFY